MTSEQEAIINGLFAPFILQKGVEMILNGLTADERKACELHWGLYESADSRQWLPEEIAYTMKKPVLEVRLLLRSGMTKMVKNFDTPAVRDLYKRVAPHYGFPPWRW